MAEYTIRIPPFIEGRRLFFMGCEYLIKSFDFETKTLTLIRREIVPFDPISNVRHITVLRLIDAAIQVEE